MLEKSNELKIFMEECLKVTINKMINDPPTGDSFDTYGIKKRRWFVEY